MTPINEREVGELLEAAGLVLDGPLRVDTPKIVRTRAADQPRHKRPGFYRLWTVTLRDGDTCILGGYGVFVGAERHSYKVPFPKGVTQRMDPGALEAARARQRLEAKREAKRQRALAERAARRAAKWWGQCSDWGTSPYLEGKGFPPGRLYGARISNTHGNLVIPLLNGKGQVQGLQVIYHDPETKRRKKRNKDFAPPGLVKKGHWFQISSPHAGGVLLLCEGFATAASLHEATGLPVVAAFDAGNLLPVAQELAKRYRGARILVCADDDYLTEPNTGVIKAEEAALALDDNAHVVVPNFAVPLPGAAPIERSVDKAHKGTSRAPTDWNDLHVHPHGGLHVVRTQIEAALASAGWERQAAAARGASGSGGSRAGHTHMGSGAGGRDGGAVGGSGGDNSGDSGRHPAPRPDAVSQMSLQDIVERFVHIDDATGEYAFDYWTKDLVKKSKIVQMLPARVRWDDVKDHPLWQSRAVYIDQLGFDPGGEDPNVVCNRWGGWPTEPKPGRCQVLLDTLRYLTSNEPREVYDWVLKWLAYPIQHPGAKMATALVFHGPQGTGKSFFFESYAKIYAEYAQILNQGAIEDRFNSDWAERKLFVVADEVVARSELYQLKNQLKGLITGDWVRVNPKNVAAHKERNHMNLVFLSNEILPAVLEKDDRRHLVVWTPGKLSHHFYDELAEEVANGGIEALHHYLLHLDIGDFRPWTRPPETKAKDELINVSRESVDRFFEEWVEGLIDGLPLCPVGTVDLYTAYLRWCRQEGVRFPRESNQFAGYVLKQAGWKRAQKDRYESTHYTGPAKRQRFFLPPEGLLERAAERGPEHDYRQRADETQTQWLTRCYLAFNNAVHGGGYGDG